MQDNQELNLTELWRILKKRKNTFFKLFAIIFISTLVVSLLIPKVYKAKAKIIVQNDTNLYPSSVFPVTSDDKVYLSTQKEIMASSFVVNKTLDSLRDRAFFKELNYDDLKKIDKWILFKMEHVLNIVTNAYGREVDPAFEFHKAYKAIYDFCNEDLSMFYLDTVKGRLYTYKASSLERRSAQTAVYEVLNCLIRMMAPILVFTSDEIWQVMPRESKDAQTVSVHLASFPVSNPVFDKESIDKELKPAIELRTEVAKKIEELRGKGAVGSSFDAKINLLTNDPARYTFLESLKSDLCEIFKVSQVEVKKEPSAKEFKVEALNADGKKCVRCWNYTSDVGKDKTHSELCGNCLKAIS